MHSEPASLPAAEKPQLALGYIRLTDSAPLVMAQELGLFRKYGLHVSLYREPSWANLRDKVVAGVLDAAQMLAPLPLATSLGAGGLRADMVTGLALSLNGNAITLSSQIAAELRRAGAEPEVYAQDASAQDASMALRDWWKRKPTAHMLTLASAHSFSCHTFLIRRWLASAGVDPDRDVRIIVLPPEQMVDSLARGVIDGFCVGEPWNTVAVQQGIGEVQATGYQIWNNLIEKVLGVTQKWHQANPATHQRLRLALMESCHWLADAGNRRHAAETLARPGYLDLPLSQLLPSLTGQFQFRKDGPTTDLPHFHVFGRFQAGFPWRSTAEKLLQECAALLGREFDDSHITSLAQQTYRTDLYREAAQTLGLPFPELDYMPTGPHPEPWLLAPGLEMGADLVLPDPTDPV